MLHMRKISSFNQASYRGEGLQQDGSGSIITSIVGNRRMSVMNNVVISSEVVEREKEPEVSQLQL